MEKKKAEEQENFDLVEKARENKKRIICISVAVIALVAACIIWYLVAQAGSRKADEAIGRADIEMTNDSLATSLYAEAANCGIGFSPPERIAAVRSGMFVLQSMSTRGCS